MPTYVYACDTCQVQFEKFQSFKDEALRTCPTCQNAVRRVIQPAGVVFKGSGWHINDYRASKGGDSGADTTVTPPVATPAGAPNDAASTAPAAAPAAAAPAAPAPSSSGTATDA